VYHSDDFKNLNTTDSGFDGTVIHLYDEKKGINQKYTIARGSEMRESDTLKPLDWEYNAFWTKQKPKEYFQSTNGNGKLSVYQRVGK
jgi:hypothetical protein